VATIQVFSTLGKFYCTHLQLPQGQEVGLNSLSNDLLSCVQWLFGQTVVKKENGYFVDLLPEQTPWLTVAFQVTAFIVTSPISVPLFVGLTLAGTAVRLLSFRSAEVYQGVFGTRVVDLQSEEKNVAQAGIVLKKKSQLFENSRTEDASEQDLALVDETSTDDADLDSILNSSLNDLMMQMPGAIPAQSNSWGSTMYNAAADAVSDAAITGMLKMFGIDPDQLLAEIFDEPLQESSQFLTLLLKQSDDSLKTCLEKQTQQPDYDFPLLNCQLWNQSVEIIMEKAGKQLKIDNVIFKKFSTLCQQSRQRLESLGLLDYWNEFPQQDIDLAQQIFPGHIQFFKDFIEFSKEKSPTDVKAWLAKQHKSYPTGLPFSKAHEFWKDKELSMYCSRLQEKLQKIQPDLLREHKKHFEMCADRLHELGLNNYLSQTDLMMQMMGTAGGEASLRESMKKLIF
jgi:hypothetical protein